MMSVISRIGITPVGSPRYRLNRLRLHILAYSLARQQQIVGGGGSFIARCDDTNEGNINRDYLDSYLHTLEDVGVRFDKTPYDKDQNGYSLFQSQRSEIYSRKIDELRAKGLAGEDGTGAVFFDTEAFSKQYKELLDGHKLEINDLTLGKLKIDIRSSGRNGASLTTQPFAIQRSNGTHLFNLTSPVDDGMMGVTHVVRDRDKLNIVARQEMVRIALDFPQVSYVHLPLLVNDEGKRFVFDPALGEATYENFRDKGFSSAAIISYLLASIGGAPEKFHMSIDSFASETDFSKLHSSHTRFSREVLRIHQSTALSEMDDLTYRAELLRSVKVKNSAYAERLALDTELLNMYARKRAPFNDLTEFESFDTDDYKKLANEGEVLKDAQSIYELFKQQLTENTFGELLSDAMKYQTALGMGKKQYYSALRLLLTGKTAGPNLGEIVEYYQLKGLLGERISRFELQINRERGEKHGFGRFI